MIQFLDGVERITVYDGRADLEGTKIENGEGRAVRKEQANLHAFGDAEGLKAG